MRLLMLSWRYIDHPAAGGAEVITHEVLKRLAPSLDEVTCFTAAYPGAAPESEIDGVRVIRSGGQATVHLHAWRWLRRRLERYDRVVDQINTIPFFTPLYVPEEKRRFMIFQLAREYWWRETRGLFRLAAPAGYLAEPRYLRRYRATDGLTSSQSTVDDLVALGVPRERISIVPLALDTEPLPELPDKDGGPLRVVIAGRLTPAKFVEEGVDAFTAAAREEPGARLDVVGGGDPRYRARLERLCARLGLRDVEFHGRVPHERRDALLAAAHVHVFTSHREGWGLVVSEAGAMGTPSVGYDVPGVRDSIADPRALVPSGDSRALGAALLRLRRDPELYRELREDAWRRARGMTLDATVAGFAAAVGLPQPVPRT